ncbi:MAG: hypothetical protein KJO32_11760 [Deltaproteobacteria bacterium]|nr:hypothetical protein [Deltaproteobacteria bacterium]
MKNLATLILALFAVLSYGQSNTGKEIVIDRAQTDDIYLAGENIRVNAPVQGDLVIAGGTLMVKDSIIGDFTGAGRELTLDGFIMDDVRAAGGKITIDSDIGDDLVVFGGEVTITENTRINGKILCYAGIVSMNGEVLEDIKIHAGEVNINGIVRGASTITGDDIIIGSDAKFYKDVQYWSSDENINFYNALVDAKAEYNEELAEEQSQLSLRTFGTKSLKLWLVYVLSALLAILAFHALFRNAFSNAVEGIENNLFKSFGYGLLYLIGVPLLILVSLYMLIGLKLGLFAAAVFVFSLLFGHTIAAILIAYYLRARYDRAWSFWTVTFVALFCVIVMRVITMIPYAGIALSVIIISITYGALTLQIFRAKKQRLQVE